MCAGPRAKRGGSDGGGDVVRRGVRAGTRVMKELGVPERAEVGALENNRPKLAGTGVLAQVPLENRSKRRASARRTRISRSARAQSPTGLRAGDRASPEGAMSGGGIGRFGCNMGVGMHRRSAGPGAA